MKIIQTFWTKNTARQDLLRINAGWLSPEYHWMSWALSCLQLQKNLGKVELNTDLNGKYVLVEIFQLPFENVCTSLENDLQGYHSQLWALAKLHTYRLQQEPFLHFDSDFFLQKPLDATFLTAQIVCQNLEKNLFFYKDTLREINQHLALIPEPCLPFNFENSDIYSCNAGIIGGRDVSFFREYADYGFHFVESNSDYSKFKNAANLNFIFEQYFIHWLASKKEKDISFLSRIVQEDPTYASHANFNNLPNVDFIHPVGGHKKNPELCAHVAKILQLDYPEYYDRIMKVMYDSRIVTSIKAHPVKTNKLQHENERSDKRSNQFSRTISALEHLLPSSEEQAPFAEMIESFSQVKRDFGVKEEFAELQLKGQSLLLLKDVYQLESKKVTLYQNCFKNDKSILTRLANELSAYEIVRSVYSVSTETILDTIVQLSSDVILVSVKRNWICKIPELTGQMIKDKFEETGDNEAELVLVPKTSRLFIEEYYLETLDSLLIEACEKEQKIREVAKQMEKYFGAAMITENYAGFIDLMVNTVKRLAYIGILLLEPTKVSK